MYCDFGSWKPREPSHSPSFEEAGAEAEAAAAAATAASNAAAGLFASTTGRRTAADPGGSGRGGRDRCPPSNEARTISFGGVALAGSRGGGSGSRRFGGGRRGRRLCVLSSGAGTATVVVVEVRFRVGGEDVLNLVMFMFAFGGCTKQERWRSGEENETS